MRRLTDRTVERILLPPQIVAVARDIFQWFALARELWQSAIMVVDVQPVR